MKTVALIALSLFTACAAPDGATTSSTEQGVTVGELGGPDANTSQFWDTSNDGTAIWPAGTSVTHTQILMRKAPTVNGQAYYLAFVVWNHATVGHIYQIPTGSTTGADFMQKWDSADLNRNTLLENNGIFDHGGGTDGSPVSGTGTPTPHPNVYGQYLFGPSYLSHLKTTAGTLDDSLDTFVHDKSISDAYN